MKLFNDDDDAVDRRNFGAPIFSFSKYFWWTAKKFSTIKLVTHSLRALIALTNRNMYSSFESRPQMFLTAWSVESQPN